MATRRCGRSWLILGAVALLPWAPQPAARAAEPESVPVYVRAPKNIATAVRFVSGEASRLDAAQVMVAFDAPTFDPPPGLTEFSLEHAFFEDLEKWIEEFVRWARTAPCGVRGTSSLAPRSIDLKAPAAAAKLLKLIRRSWWQGERPAKLEPAARWMGNILARNDAPVRQQNGRDRRLLVLVTGAITPERWVRADPEHGYESEWRTKLLPIGTYFDPARVSAALHQARCTLCVIAPEARFGDFTPFVEVPALPWAARPQLPTSDFPWRLSQATRRPSGRRGGGSDSLRRMLEKAFKDLYPDPEERRRKVDEAVREMGRRRPTPTTPSTPGGTPLPGMVPSHQGGLRFVSSTPVWFRMLGGIVPFNDHAPSGYGVWPFARAAAKTGGRYVFYPFPPARWLDQCPANPTLLRRLAPELVSRAAYITARKGDPALDAIGRATSLVVDDTPWADTVPQHRAAKHWTSFPRTAPLRMERKTFLRRKPYDDALWGSERSIERIGERLRDETLPRYDKALAILAEAVRKCAGRDGARAHPRAKANLKLTRYWMAMSAFHLEAYSIYAREIQRFIPEDMKGHVQQIVVTYVPTIKMSDVLDAYDGRRLPLEDEAQYGRWEPSGAPGYQGNMLDIPVEDPNYRARRETTVTLRFLDKRLRRRALVMIEAARDVMRDYAETGWGWTTYYAEAFTFVFKPIRVPTGHRPSRGGGKAPPRPTTPQGGGKGGGGSKGGGATTK